MCRPAVAVTQVQKTPVCSDNAIMQLLPRQHQRVVIDAIMSHLAEYAHNTCFVLTHVVQNLCAQALQQYERLGSLTADSTKDSS